MKVGFIGAGKMARSVVSGLYSNGMVRPAYVLFSSRSRESGEAFLDLGVGAVWTDNNEKVMTQADLIILAIKPQQFAAVLPTLHEASAGKLVLSLAAGITLAQMSEWLHPTARLVRAMPNMMMQIGLGASVFAGGPGATDADLTLIERVLGSVGKAFRVDESQINAVTALSGSGPAYVFHFIDALVRAAIPLGLDEKLARELALQTVLGSATLAAQSELAPLELAAQVKSPRGTTLAGCAVLEENDALNVLMTHCLGAAKARAEALARGEA